MALIDVPRCPRCGLEVDPADLRREYRRRRTLFDQTRWGIRCPTCNFVSKIRRGRAHVVSFAVMGSGVAVGFSLKGIFPGLGAEGQLIAFLAVMGIALIVQMRWAPLFIQLESPSPGETLHTSRPDQSPQAP